MKRIFISLISVLVPLLMSAEEQEMRLLRFPSVGQDKIAFTYAGDLYTVSINGGPATRLTSHIGYEIFSRFSPDGKTIAFTGQFDGNTEVYTIPVEGGSPKRLTYTATVSRDNLGERMGPNNIVMCWTPDGKNVVMRSKWHSFTGLRGQLSTVPAEGGELTPIPTSEGGFCSYSPDGKMFAFNRMFREFRTWKYYKGGQADDIWINKVGTTELQNITNNDFQDIFPMWIGDEIYYLSDRDHIMNMFCYNTKTAATRKVTNFDKYDCKFPSFSQKYIVFENGGYIYRFDVATQKCEKVPVYMNPEGLYARDKVMTYNNNWSSGYSMSPDGKRIVTTFRGDIFTVPGTVGATYNLMPSQGTFERDPKWSPDGKMIAFTSDITGEYQIYVMPFDKPEEKVCLTRFKKGTPRRITWSDDSKSLYFTSIDDEFISLDVKTKKQTVLFKKEDGFSSAKLSPDGKWIVYSASSKATGKSVIYLYNRATKVSTPVTTEWYSSNSPMFSEDGNYLFFRSSREFSPRYSSTEWNASYSVYSSVFMLPLNKNVKTPWNIEGDEYVPATEENAAATENTEMTVDLDGIIDRAVELEGLSSYFEAFNGFVYFNQGGKIKKMSLNSLKISNVGNGSLVSFTPDHKKALIRDNGGYYVVPFPSLAKKSPVPFKDMQLTVNYHKEWAQIYRDTWRNFRDNFYVENMVGKDWDYVYEKYAELLPYVNYREDLTYILGEMVGELETGHCYITSGQTPRAEKIKTGLLGAKFSKDAKSGYFKVNKIFKGETWGDMRRSPLAEPGLDVKVGDYILEVDGQDLKSMGTIYQTLVGRVGKVTALKVNTRPSKDGARVVYVKPIADESQLAYFDWVQENIRKVDEMSNGQIGYIHIPDMTDVGLDEFTRLFYPQLKKKALIIDDRMNGGGNVSPMIMERLSRVVYRMNMYRGNAEPSTIPDATHHGPKVCLVDKYSSSDGDLFPYSFQRMKLGKIIGKRTWGGIVGIGGSSQYLDGQNVTVPFFTSYSTDGKWIVENHGVDPDIDVDINPFEDYLGNDAQLNKAVEVLLEELKSYKPLPRIPKDPIR